MGVCASYPGKPYSSVERRKLFAGKSPGVCVSLRLIPGKALFFRRGAQTFCRGKAPAAVWVCASYPGKPYSSVKGRKPFAGKSPGVCVSLRLIPGKALFFRRGAQTFCREEAPAAVRVCASFPGKPYSSVEGRKLFAGKSHRRRWGFAPHTRESLILPSRGANFLPGRATGGGGGLRLISRKALFFRREAQTFCREKPRRLCEFAPCTRESLIPPLRGANRFPGSRRGVGARNPARP